MKSHSSQKSEIIKVGDVIQAALEAKGIGFVDGDRASGIMVAKSTGPADTMLANTIFSGA